MSARKWVITPLVLPVGDKRYEIAPVDYTVGLELQQVQNGTHGSIGKDSPEADLFKLAMGPVWDQMQDDKQPYPAVFRAGMASVQYQMALVAGLDVDAAVAIGEQAWNASIDPEALAAALTAANQDSMTDGTSSTGSESARKTRSPASTNATKSRRTTRSTSTPKKKTATQSNGTGSGRKSGSAGPRSSRTSPASTTSA